MSRLDSFLRRIRAQRDCLNAAVALVAQVPGPVFELGLGNGRTYDHLRRALPQREVFVFERAVSAHPGSIPDPGHLFEGQIEDTLDQVRTRFAGSVALAHADLGSGQEDQDRRTAAIVSTKLPLLMARGGVIVSDQELKIDSAETLPLPADVRPGRYFMYRCC